MISFQVNGKSYSVDVPPDTPLLWVIRDHLKLTGTKFGCGIGECGSCTVHIDGKAHRSCITSVGDVQGKKVTTIEGLRGRVAEAVQSAWDKIQVPQCGYCQSGQVLAATALLTSNPRPSDADIDQAMQFNLCRCGTYRRIRHAIHEAAKALEA